MLIKRLYDTRLAQACYLVGCQATGTALVIDPARDIDTVLAAAKAEGMSVAFAAETHIHADFVSGVRELASRGVQPVLSREGGSDWSYRWAAEAGARLVGDGDELMVGKVRVEVLHTPGHTPEHVCFRITDTEATDRPMGVFTGDFIFVGDVGRPDLLEKAAGVRGTMDQAARALFHSLQRFKKLPDWLQLWPGHGAGSACGKALGSVPSSTLGYERVANWGLRIEREDEFVREVLAGQPEPPPYFAVMKRVNRDGPPVLGVRARPPMIAGGKLRDLARSSLVVDTRKTAEFARGHVPGTVNVPFGNAFATYAGTVLPYGRPLHLIVPESQLSDALAALASVGLDDVAGWFRPEAVGETGTLETTTQLAPQEVAERLRAGTITVVDVRGRSEWDEGHIAGARHIPLGGIAGHADDLRGNGAVVLHCETGSRSFIAASLLLARGASNVANLSGGLLAWQKAGLKVTKEGGVAAGVH